MGCLSQCEWTQRIICHTDDCSESEMERQLLYINACIGREFGRRRQWQPTPVLLPGKSHGWRSLVGSSLWGRKESDTTERLPFLFSLSCIGEGHGNPTPAFLPGESQGRGSLVGSSLWGREELDTTERLPFHFSLSCIAEGNGNPLQCSCLENPRDGGAWWAAVCGVAQSRTRLKQLSSSSSSREFGKLVLRNIFAGQEYRR